MKDDRRGQHFIDIQRGLAIFWIGVTLAGLVYLWQPDNNELRAAFILLVFSTASIFLNLRGLLQYQNQNNVNDRPDG